uniref:Zinc finger and BTB domain containing 22b n=1 Tax=Paramormyrops kingsleyae TaxID=1676925 RepID=A0A3B3Q6X6_9TELE|nr:zinc finger and BTB domain-containing protein 22-like [Paramormyrops kingsleyae]XP_023686289.1 zinc finger and BTB domain-containing protein 22-like [Paramormyrops kingsleyae]
MSVSVEQGCSSSSCSGTPAGSVVEVSFPSVRTAVLDSLNRQREEGRLCDLSIQVQGQVFRAHRCVLAASSPYFHDQVLLKNMSTVSIPAVMDPLAFESVLSCAYTGQLRMLREDIVNYLTVGSVLQMWHIVDKCTELLKESRGSGSGPHAGGTQGNTGCSSSNSNNGSSSGMLGVGAHAGDTHSGAPPPSRPALNESQSPSSTNYFSPRETGFGGGTAAAGASGDGAINSTPSYCTPSGGDESFLIEEDDEDEELLYPRKQERGSGRRKKTSSVSDQEVGVSDSFGVSSYQDGDPCPPQKRPTYSQPSIMPRKQWVVVKTERPQDDELIVVSGEEGGEEDEDRDMELERVRERERTFNISDVRTLSGEMGTRGEAEMEAQVDYCQSSEDYLKFDSDLMDQSAPQHAHNTSGNSSGRAISALLGPVQSGATRAQLFPIDMQGNQILLYSQGTLEPSPAGAVVGGASLKGMGLEHGAVHLSGQGGLDGLDGAGGGASGKVFMCHCGKTFTHKSMRDRHINMHLDLRPFHCPVCAKKFKMKHHLTEHMKTHTGLKPYDCHSCGKKFMWRDSFMRHRSHCERRGGGSAAEAGAGLEGAGIISSPHHTNSDVSQRLPTSGVGGRSGVPVMSPHHSSSGSSVSSLTMTGSGPLLGVSSQSSAHSLGSAVFGLGGNRGGCEDEVCEVTVSESSVT